MCRGASDLQPVATSGLNIRGANEARDDGGACGVHRSGLVGAACTELQAWTMARRGAHTGGCGSHGGVVVEDREDDRFDDAGFSESSRHRKNGRVGEVAFTFRVAVDVPAEAVVR